MFSLPSAAGPRPLPKNPVFAVTWRNISMYSPTIGRFLSRDPIGLGPDTNPYRYCGNSPTNGTDPSGQLKIKIGGYVFYVHENDPDPFPSQPHGHVGSPTSSLKVNVETGELFQGTAATGKNIGKKALSALRARLRAAG